MKSRILIIAIGALASASALSAQGLINMAQKAKSSAQSAALKTRKQTQNLKFQVDRKIDEHAYPLHAAVQKDDLAKVKELIATGADVNQKDRTDMTPLTIAVGLLATEIIIYLLNHGANPNVENPYIGHSMLSFIIGAFPDELVTPELISLFIAKGADIHPNDFLGHSSLVSAAIRNRPDIVKLLLQAGADVNAKDSNGLTALELLNVVAINNPDVVIVKDNTDMDFTQTKKLLIDAGAK